MNSQFYISDFCCTRCGRRSMALPRKTSKQHEPGHLKKIWCVHCNKETNMAEIRPFGAYTLETFNIEYEMGNFDEDGKRKETYKQCLARYYKEKER